MLAIRKVYGKDKRNSASIRKLSIYSKATEFKFLTTTKKKKEQNSQKIPQFLSTGTCRRITTDSSGKEIDLTVFQLTFGRAILET